MWFEDHAALCSLFDELDEFHRQARPDFFRPFDGPARTPGQIEQWLTGPGSTVLVGLAVLFMRPASTCAGARCFYERFGFIRSLDRLMMVA